MCVFALGKFHLPVHYCLVTASVCSWEVSFYLCPSPLPPSHPPLRLSFHPLSDANLHVCSTSQDSRRGGRGREGKRDEEERNERSWWWKEHSRGRRQREGMKGQKGREAKCQVWPKCHSWPSPAGGRVLFYTHLVIAGSVFLTFISPSPPSSLYSMNQSFALKAFSLLLPSPSSPPLFISHVGFLSALRCESSLLLLHSSSPPVSSAS